MLAADRRAAGPGPALRQRTVRHGPIPLPPAVPGGETPVTALVPNLPAPCTDCYVTGTRIDMVYEDGRPANLDTGVMMHHLVLFQQGRPDITCGPDTPLGQLGQRFFAAGNERTSGDLPAGFGYHLGRRPMNAIFEIMNHSQELKTVFITATVSYVPDSAPGMKPVTPVWLDENNCGNSEYRVPAGRSNKVARWTSTITGRVLAAAGHVHDGGIKTVLTNESTRQHICTSSAGYDTKPAYRGSVESMSTCIWDRLGTVRAGEVLALDTHYDVPAPRSGVMGIMIAFVHETADLAGGTPPPATAPAPEQKPPPSSG